MCVERKHFFLEKKKRDCICVIHGFFSFWIPHEKKNEEDKKYFCVWYDPKSFLELVDNITSYKITCKRDCWHQKTKTKYIRYVYRNTTLLLFSKRPETTKSFLKSFLNTRESFNYIKMVTEKQFESRKICLKIKITIST